MSTDEYVPSEDEMITGLVQLPDEPAGLCRRVHPDEMKRGLARVRREAKAEVLRETADWWAANPDADVFETDGDTRNWLRDVATEYEAGDGDDRADT